MQAGGHVLEHGPPEHRPEPGRVGEATAHGECLALGRLPRAGAHAGQQGGAAGLRAGKGAEGGAQGAHEGARRRHEDPLVDPLGGQAQAGGGECHDRAGAAAGGELDADPGAERVAEDVHAPEPPRVEVGLNGVGERGDGRPRVPIGDSPWPGRSTARTSKSSARRGIRAEKSSRVEPMPWSSRSGSPCPVRSKARVVIPVPASPPGGAIPIRRCVPSQGCSTRA